MVSPEFPGIPADFLISNLFGADAASNWGDPKTVTFDVVYYYGLRVVRVNGINILGRGTFYEILRRGDRIEPKPSFTELLEEPSGGWLFGGKTDHMLDFWCGFRYHNSGVWLWYEGMEETGYWVRGPYGDFSGEWVSTGYRYVGGKYTDVEIAYYLAGYSAAHFGMSPMVMHFGIDYYNWKLGGGKGFGHLGQPGKHFWAQKGWNEYNSGWRP